MENSKIIHLEFCAQARVANARVRGDPHNHDNLISIDGVYAMEHNYLGQHPMCAQAVVHDKNGNLLFFTVDDNIYNRFEVA